MLALILEFAMKYSYGCRDYDMDDTMSCGSCETDNSMEGSETCSQAIMKTVSFVNNASGDQFNLSMSVAGFVQPISGINVGAERWNRIGRRIALRNICLRFWPQSFSGSTTGDACRWLLVYDKQTNLAKPSVASILQSYGNTGVVNTSAMSGYNPDNCARYEILADWWQYLVPIPSGQYPDGFNPMCIECSIPLKQRVIQFGSDTVVAFNDMSTTVSGGLYLLGIGQNGNQIALQCWFQLDFFDV